VGSANLPKTWPNAFIPKYWFPALLFFFIGIFLFSGGSPNLYVRLAVFIPMIAFGVRLLRTGQLRSDGRVHRFRRWYRWQILPIEDTEEIRQGFWAGEATVKLAGRPKKLRFFIEEENEHLLGFKAGSEPLRERLTPPPVHPLHPALLSLLGVGGFVLGMLVPLPPHHISLLTVSSDWITRYANFQNQLSIPMGVIIVILFARQIRDKTLRNPHRATLAFLIGIGSAGLLREIDSRRSSPRTKVGGGLAHLPRRRSPPFYGTFGKAHTKFSA